MLPGGSRIPGSLHHVVYYYYLVYADAVQLIAAGYDLDDLSVDR